MGCKGFNSTVKQSLILSEFVAPKWLPENLRHTFPQMQLKLACIPTPIQSWLQLDNGRKIFIKRDDQTGSSLSGNKVRKLEFIMGDMLQKGYDAVITCGGLQSNHCRAVAVIAAQLQIECHLLLRTDITTLSDLPSTGNFLLSRLSGAYQYLVGNKEQYIASLRPRAEKLADLIKRERNKRAYIVPVGGSDGVGLYGYFMAFDEILQQCPTTVRNIFITCGSGGTLAGLTIANYLNGNKFRIYGISVCDNAAYFYGHVQEMLDLLGLTDQKAENLCCVIDGYKGGGYGISCEDERDFIANIAASTGIFLDPVYTGKAARGMVEQLKSKPESYHGDSLFIHTGGIFGIFGEKGFDQTHASLCGYEKTVSRATIWKDSNENPVMLT